MNICNSPFKVARAALGRVKKIDGWTQVDHKQVMCALHYFNTALEGDEREKLKVTRPWFGFEVIQAAQSTLDVIKEMIGEPMEEVTIKVLGQRSYFGGMYDPREPNKIYIRPYRTIHPLAAVGTIIHESAHLLEHRNVELHRGTQIVCPAGSHCKAWELIAKQLTAAFQVSKYLINRKYWIPLH